MYIALHGKKFFLHTWNYYNPNEKKNFLGDFINAEKLAAHPAQQKLGSKFLGKYIKLVTV